MKTLTLENRTYVEGGKVANWIIATGIDILISVLPALAALNTALKVGKLAKLGRTYIRTNLDNALKRAKIGLAVSTLVAIVDVLMIAISSSIGTIVASLIDKLDGKKNGYCFG
jgi:hypothetical protein